ncbi:MAG: hypothetical protein MJE68_32630 [Proteobacteria bacterium]|nr:hypothetical protein [Pseudomonadota bacterium]
MPPPPILEKGKEESITCNVLKSNKKSKATIDYVDLRSYAHITLSLSMLDSIEEMVVAYTEEEMR